ncbi:MAG TPA: sugar kinase [Trueperaceae bacterium]
MTAPKPGAREPRRYDVTSVGETMLRYSVAPGEHFTTATSFRVDVGGAESNVCAALARLGRRTAWASALPDNPLGALVLDRLRAAGVDTAGVRLLPGTRLGTYYLKPSLVPNMSAVVYDRAGSAFTALDPADLDLATLLDTTFLHATGITAALGEGPRRLLGEVLREARSAGVRVSFDVNHRETLWQADQARTVLPEFMAQADVLFCSARDAARLFGAAPTGPGAASALRRHSQAELIVVTLGDRGAYARLGDEELTVPAVPTQVVDRPGAGDAMIAGVLDGLLDGDVRAGLERGAVLAAVALSHHGDMVAVTRGELEAALARTTGDIAR